MPNNFKHQGNVNENCTEVLSPPVRRGINNFFILKFYCLDLCVCLSICVCIGVCVHVHVVCATKCMWRPAEQLARAGYLFQHVGPRD